jgi:hypothetical protein
LDCVYYQNKIFCFGGLDPGTRYILDISTGVWTTGPISAGNGWETCVALVPEQGKIYLFGGEKVNGITAAVTSDVYSYDIATQTYQKEANLSSGLLGCEAEYHSSTGKIIVLGSTDAFEGTACQDCAYSFDPVTRVVTQLPDLPTPRGRSASGLLGNRMVVTAGGTSYYNGGNAGMTAVSESYDVYLNTWNTDVPYPYPVRETGSVVRSNALYVFGGMDNNAVFSPDVYKYSCIGGLTSAVTNVSPAPGSIFPNTQVSITFTVANTAGVSPDLIINWGMGSDETVHGISLVSGHVATHTYPTAGDYCVKYCFTDLQSAETCDLSAIPACGTSGKRAVSFGSVGISVTASGAGDPYFIGKFPRFISFV